jgi:guanylate kinase
MTEQEAQQLLSNIAFINLGYVYIDPETIKDLKKFLEEKNEDD